ncbi:3-oxoacyl-ACP synthase III family protein [Bartonella sp. LJL80]
MNHLPVTMKGIGIALPENRLSTVAIERKFGLKTGTIEKRVGVKSRPVLQAPESQITLAKLAAENAIVNADIDKASIDLVLFAAAVGYQPIPATAPLLMRSLSLTGGQAAAFDINATCLSFLAGFDVAASLLSTQRYKTILLVSSEVASCALPWQTNIETAALFGDGAAATVLVRDETKKRGVVGAHMETYPEGYEDCQIGAGGTRISLAHEYDDFVKSSVFAMEGKALFRHTVAHFDGFLERTLAKAGWAREDVDLVIPHQASPLALAHLVKQSGLANAEVINIMADHGNQIAASIPIALHHAAGKGLLSSGARILFLGTSAGLSFGALAYQA